MAVGSITVDTSLRAHGDSITMSSGQVGKLLFYGVTANSTNSVLTVVDNTVTSGAEIVLSIKGASDNGSIGTTLGCTTSTDTVTSAMVPIYLDDSVSLRLNGALASTGDMCLVSYMRVE